MAGQEAQEGGCFNAKAPTHFQANDDQARKSSGYVPCRLRRAAAVTERPGSTSARGAGSQDLGRLGGKGRATTAKASEAAAASEKETDSVAARQAGTERPWQPQTGKPLHLGA